MERKDTPGYLSEFAGAGAKGKRGGPFLQPLLCHDRHTRVPCPCRDRGHQYDAFFYSEGKDQQWVFHQARKYGTLLALCRYSLDLPVSAVLSGYLKKHLFRLRLGLRIL